MKKIFLIMSICALSFSLVACGNKTDVPNDNQEVVGSDNETSGIEETPGDSVEAPTVSNEMETLLNDLYTETEVAVRIPYSTPIESTRAMEFIGLSEEDFNANVTDSVVSESMISPSNYSLCIIKVKEGSDKEVLKESIFENANPMKWVCMSADYVLVADAGDYIMLAMTSKENCISLKNALVAKYPDNNGDVLEKLINEAE